MIRHLALLAALFMAAPALASSQIAEVICDTREAMLMRMERTHGAERQGWGIRGSNALLEIWSIPLTGDRTLVQSYANGRPCIIAMGEGWEMLVDPADPA